MTWLICGLNRIEKPRAEYGEQRRFLEVFHQWSRIWQEKQVQNIVSSSSFCLTCSNSDYPAHQSGSTSSRVTTLQLQLSLYVFDLLTLTSLPSQSRLCSVILSSTSPRQPLSFHHRDGSHQINLSRWRSCARRWQRGEIEALQGAQNG